MVADQTFVQVTGRDTIVKAIFILFLCLPKLEILIFYFSHQLSKNENCLLKEVFFSFFPKMIIFHL